MNDNMCNNPVSVGFKVPVRVSRETKPDASFVNVSGVDIGGKEVIVIAGPCAVESREQLFDTARAVEKAGARILRGGAFKPPEKNSTGCWQRNYIACFLTVLKVQSDHFMKLIKLSFQACFFFVFMAFFLPVISNAQDPEGNRKIVKIGLLIPDSKSLAARNGAELAIRRANEKGGVNRLTFQLVTRSMEGPWGTGSKEAVSMIFDENVTAIMGSHDGRNAHIVEQVTTKSRVVFLSAWASDPTLSQAFVPWFFNCIHNDLQQANALIEESYKRRKLTKIAVISDNGYDSESSLKNFLKKAESMVRPEPLQFSYDNTKQDFNYILNAIKSSEIDCIILFVQPPASLKIIKQLKIEHINQPVFGSQALLDENAISSREIMNYENIIFVSSVNMSGKKGISFIEDYIKTYGVLPGAVAAYAFDGMNILIEAIRKSGPDRDKVKGSMAETKYEGVTGIIQFDEKGNRLGAAGLVQIHNGIPVTLAR